MYQIKLILTDTMRELTNTAELRFMPSDNLVQLVKETLGNMLNVWENPKKFEFPKNFNIDISKFNITTAYSEVCVVSSIDGVYELSVRVKIA